MTINEGNLFKKSTIAMNLEDDATEELEDQLERKSEGPEFDTFGTALNEL
jgi:hypothetical protein